LRKVWAPLVEYDYLELVKFPVHFSEKKTVRKVPQRKFFAKKSFTTRSTPSFNYFIFLKIKKGKPFKGARIQKTYRF
jgi:hypothetical protein